MANIDTKLKPKELKNIGTIAGIISAIILTYYVTGVYKNYLQIKKLKEENDNGE